MQESTKCQQQYTVDNLRVAFDAICAGMPVRKASEMYKIPKMALCTLCKCAQMTPLKPEQEARLEKWILCCSRSGYPTLGSATIAAEAREMFPELAGSKIILGKNWFRNYCSRRPRVAHAMANTPKWPVSFNFDSKQLCAWFQHIGAHLCEAGVEDVRQQPQRVFHCMYGRYHSMSAVLAYSASSRATPPLLLLPPEAEGVTLPVGWARYAFANTPNIDDNVLLYYLENVLHRYLKHINVQFPVIVYVNHQRQPPNSKVFELCQRLGIVLINLYPWAFQRLHNELAQSLEQWQLDTNTQYCNDQYARGVEALKHALVFTLIKRKMAQSFEEHGIYPFDVSAVDMSQLVPAHVRGEVRDEISHADRNDGFYDDNDKATWSVHTYVCSSESD